MKTKHIFTIVACLIITNIFSQTNLNDYKYVIVPKKYDFLKEADKYQLNSLTKFLFKKEGFIAIFEGDTLPEEVINNRCLVLNSNVLDDSGMFKTKLTLQLTNCKNEIVFKTRIGSTKKKEFKAAYHEALRNAFKSFKEINYSYTPKKVEHEIVEVDLVKEEPIVEKPVIKETPKVVEEVRKEKKLIVERPAVKKIVESNILYAQAINNGYQLVDSTPKVVMILLSTPKQDVYIVKGKDAIVYKENGLWLLSIDSINTEGLNIKF